MNDPCHPVCSIIPPHMVDCLRLRGDASQRAMAERMEAFASRTRVLRQSETPAAGFLVAPAAVGNQPKRETCDAKQGTNLPGKRARFEADGPVAEAEVNDAHDGAGDTYHLYRDVYGRDSLDKGMKLISTVHFDVDFNNAFWNGQQMVYGDGDGAIFVPFTRSLSVVAHELSHGVVQFSGGLIYQDQSGALNESFADVFGALTVQHVNGQEAHEADWLIGDGILGPAIQGTALRSLKAPGTAYADPLLGQDPQPFHMADFVVTSSDNGGVHINSGIPNHAFYLLAQYLGGFAWEKAGHIWYDTMQAINNPHATFREWADTTLEVARNRHGPGSLEALYTRRAWKLVGVEV